MQRETIQDLSDSLARERYFKGFVFICLIVALAAMGPDANVYLKILLFALLADLIALNRLRRLVALLEKPSAKAEAATDE